MARKYSWKNHFILLLFFFLLEIMKTSQRLLIHPSLFPPLPSLLQRPVLILSLFLLTFFYVVFFLLEDAYSRVIETAMEKGYSKDVITKTLSKLWDNGVDIDNYNVCLKALLAALPVWVVSPILSMHDRSLRLKSLWTLNLRRRRRRPNLLPPRSRLLLRLRMYAWCSRKLINDQMYIVWSCQQEVDWKVEYCGFLF